jgi:hypothetical protein
MDGFMDEIKIDTIKISKRLNLPPMIKDRDTRCSTRCSQNWSKSGQKPPIGHYCECDINSHKLI